jgi:AraC family transcriptional regulator
MSTFTTPSVSLLADVGPSLAKCLGFSPEFTSDGQASPRMAFHAWNGRSEDVELESFEMPMIIYQVGGVQSVPVRVDGRPYGTSRPCRVSIIPPRTRSTWGIRGEVTSRTLCFNPNVMAAVNDHLGHQPSLRLICGLRDPVMAGVIDELERELRAPSQCGALYAESATDFLALHMLRRASPVGPRTTTRTTLSRRSLARVMELLNEGIENGVSLDELARAATLSRAYFAVAFKEATGTSAHRYLTQLRIDRARLLLLHTDLTLSEIALQCGFCNQSHLTTTFRAFTGFTPTQFRRQA